MTDPKRTTGLHLRRRSTRELMARALRLRDRGAYSDAVECLLAVLERDAASVPALVMLGGIFYAVGLFPEAAKHFRRAAELDPRSAAAARGLADSLRRMGLGSNARAELAKGGST